MTNLKIFIRHATPNDLAELQTLFVDTISTICKDDYSPSQIKAWTASVENTQPWLNKLTSQHFLVAQSGNKIVGYASLENNDYVDFLYVHKDFQRRGIAESLYSEIEAESIKNGTTILSTDASITAKPFFEKRGFMAIKTQTNKIQDIEITNYKMTKKLYPVSDLEKD